MDILQKELIKKGVVKGRSKLLSNIEVKELESLILQSKDEHLKKGEVFQNIVSIDKRIDELIEKILTNPEIKETLIKVLGEDYLLLKIEVRYNLPDDKGLMMHQDSPGQVSLMLLVNDQLDGSTVFFPGSQLIPSEKHLARKVSWNSMKLMNIVKFFLMSAKGNAGDHYYFINRTWHGRTHGKSNKTKISIFFQCYPIAAKRKDLCKNDLNQSEINWELVTQPTIKKMMSMQNHYSAIEAFEKINGDKNPLSMKVNSYSTILKNKFYFTYIILKLISMEILFIPITLKRFFKNLIS